MNAKHPGLFELDMYLEGELTPAEMETIGSHLADCAPCREALEERRAMLEAVGGLPPVEVPKDFSASVLERLRELPSPARGFRPFLFPAAVLCFMSAALLLVLGLRIVPGWQFPAGGLVVLFWKAAGCISAVIKAAVIFVDLVFRFLGDILKMVPSGLFLGAAGALSLMAGGFFFGYKKLHSPGVRS